MEERTDWELRARNRAGGVMSLNKGFHKKAITNTGKRNHMSLCWNVCAGMYVCVCARVRAHTYTCVNVYAHGHYQNKVISCQMLKRAVSTRYNKNETDHCFSLVVLILI